MKNIKLTLLVLTSMFFSLNLASANVFDLSPSQKIKGVIRNSANQQKIIGASLFLEGKNIKKNLFSNKHGAFCFDSIEVGRYSLKISYIGYKTQVQNIVLTSGKELIVNIQLDESYIEVAQIRVQADKDAFKSINSSSIVSTTQFSTDDVQRFAGSRGDPARMAQNFAGVLGVSSLRNDIIIRGGSPTELLWRMDGLDIPNPNHFGTQGSTGGPVGAINSGLLSNSDFITGAFPSDYGDKMSGVFDLKTRNGNDEKYEYLGQITYNGVELGAEGPLKFTDGSFIANYRYSFLDIFNKLGMDLGIVGIPRYSDGMVKMHFNLNDKNQISVTSLYGTDNIFMQRDNRSDVATGDWNLKNSNRFYSIGVNWQYLFSEKVIGKLLVGLVNQEYSTNIDSLTCSSTDIHKVVSMDKWFMQNSSEGSFNFKYDLLFTPAKNHWITVGIEDKIKFYKLEEKRYTSGWGDYTTWDLNKEGNSFQMSGFVNWNWKITEDLTSNIGVYSQYLKISNQVSLEPRLALSWVTYPGQAFSLGIGVHKQSLPLLLYYSAPGNEKLDYMQSIHYVAGYSIQPTDNMSLKAELYYKDISSVPISSGVSDSWSFLNSGTNFGSVGGKTNLSSSGIGRCYGSELSFVKHFSDGYYLTSTASYARQQFKGSDGVLRFGGFDNIYIFNVLAGYEWVINKSFTIEFSGKYTLAGGAPYTPIDVETSKANNQTYYLNSQSFSVRKPDYRRFDLKIDFRNNYEKITIIGFVSIENLFNAKNVLEYQWSNSKKNIETVNQLGIFPLGGFRIEF